MIKRFPLFGKSTAVRLMNRDDVFAVAASLAFGIAVFVAIATTRNASNVAAIWPANGILLAALLMRPHARSRHLTSTLCFLANIIAGLVHGDTIAVSVSFAAINILEATIAFGLIRAWIGSNLMFSNWRTVARFVLIAGLAAPALPALMGAAVAHVLVGSDFLDALKTWFPADSLGLLVITPACLVMTEKHSGVVRTVTAKEIAYQFGLLAVVTAIVFGQSVAPLLFLLVPVLVSIAFRLGPRYAALASLLITVVAIACTRAGHGPAALVLKEHLELRVWVVQLFCLVNLLTSLAVAAAVAERDRLRLELERLSRSAEEARKKLDVALAHMSQGVCLFDADDKIKMWNDRFLELYGLAQSEVHIGTEFSDLIKICDRAGSSPQSASYAVNLKVDCDIDQRLRDGRYLRISQRLLEDGGVVCTYTDISADKRSEDELLYRTRHDVLTELPNRRMLSERLDQLVASSIRGSRFAVISIDVDHFKAINDNHGHAVGDELLKTVAQNFLSSVRDVDLVARLGGDEFAILLSDVRGPEEVECVAQRILQSIKRPILIGDTPLQVGLSVGIAIGPRDGNSPDTILKAADTALYKAKQSGRNTFAYFFDWGVPRIAHGEAQQFQMPRPTNEAA